MSIRLVKALSALAVLSASVSISAQALAQTSEATVQAAAAAQIGEPQFARFAPSSNGVDKTIDYSIWDEAMKSIVVTMGPASREAARLPGQSFGTRRQYGHTSLYRLEGNRIMFSFLDADVIESFAEYRKDLEATADAIDIQSLSKNEQLAYWINLHNVALVEQIAKGWPVRQPRDMKVDGVALDEARFITVNGIAMSPKDIRTQIVYPNWNDPKVMYGFWRGEIGGPSIQREAYNADNVARLLDRGALEFVNSLRGTEKRGDTLNVSKIYAEAAPFYFNDFEADLRSHLAAYASDEVKELITATSSVDAVIEEPDIADLAGGFREPSYLNITTTGGDGIERQASFRIPQSMTNLLRERDQKIQKAIKEGRTGTVTFQPFTMPGEEDKVQEVE